MTTTGTDPRAPTRTEWLGQTRFEGKPWQPTGRFDHEPTVEELRSKAWNVAASRPRGTDYPTQVRAVTVTYTPGPSAPFQEPAR